MSESATALTPALPVNLAPVPLAPAATDGAALSSHVLRCWLMFSLGLLLAGVALHDYQDGQEFEFLRVRCLVAGIAAGVGIAFCFGGGMYYLDRVLEWRNAAGGRLAWYWRLGLVTHKRLMLIGQLAGAAIVVLCVLAFIFDKPISTQDWGVMDRGWTGPPATAPNTLTIRGE